MAYYWNLKTDSLFKKEWDEFKDHHSTADYKLKYVFEMYLPFWQCKQNIVVEKDLEMDRFSKILLELISNGHSSHADICQILGIDKDNFCNMQFSFLMKNSLIREGGSDGYEITYEGLEFLANKKKPRAMETEEFDYMVQEKFYFLENDMTNSFFDSLKPIDKQLSELKKESFSGYKVEQTHKIMDEIKNKPNKVYIKHSNNPTYRKVENKRNDFSIFFNAMNPDKIFYDFADSDFESHKRSICFLGFWYENEAGDRIVDIRQFKNSVEAFEDDKYEFEIELSKKVTEYVLKNDVRVENSQEKTVVEIAAIEQNIPKKDVPEEKAFVEAAKPRELEDSKSKAISVFKGAVKRVASISDKIEEKFKQIYFDNEIDFAKQLKSGDREISKAEAEAVLKDSKKNMHKSGMPLGDPLPVENNMKDIFIKAANQSKVDADGYILMNEFAIIVKKLGVKWEGKFIDFLKNYENIIEFRSDTQHYARSIRIKCVSENNNIDKPQAAENKFCPECGKKLKLNAKFCTQCGTKQEPEVE